MVLKNEFRDKASIPDTMASAVAEEARLRVAISQKEARIKAILDEDPPCTFIYDEHRQNGQIVMAQIALVPIRKNPEV